jgi:hypothetical protein
MRILRRSLALVLSAIAGALPAAPALAADESATCPPQAAPHSAERMQRGMREARDHGFLWRISKGGRSSYLYGTIHAAREDWMYPGPTIVDAIRGSDVVALELDVLDPAIQQRLATSIGPSRADPLPPALVRRLERRRAVECVDAAVWGKFAPEFQVASLTVLAARRDGFDPAYAIDLVLAGVGRELGKAVLSLETPEGQMQALQMPTHAETIAFVDDALKDLEAGRARPMLNRIARIWVEGNYAELSNYAKWCDCLRTRSERAAMKRMLDDRNPALAASIDSLHAGGKQVFAAVGSLHMIGPNGLPALMKKRGYKVEQGDFGR